VKRESLHLNNILSITLIITFGAVSEVLFTRKAEGAYDEPLGAIRIWH
jgi:hypothetical protein